MLTIKNFDKIVNKTLGKKNYYVARIEETYNVTQRFSNKYIFELSNGKYAITITLDRMPAINEQNYYRLYAKSGIPIYLTIGEIKNIDKFLDKIRLVALG